MKVGIKIRFDKKDNCHFINEYKNNINPDILIISLLETINDICKEYDFDTNEKLLRYIELGSVDDDER